MLNGDRMKEAYDLSVEAFNAAVNILEDASDMGVALAAATVLKNHVSSYVDSSLTLGIKHFEHYTGDDE